jgi:hypothetical protein
VESLSVNDIYQILVADNPLLQLAQVQKAIEALERNQDFKNYLMMDRE